MYMNINVNDEKYFQQSNGIMNGIYFEYGEKEIEYLKKRDKKLARVIEQIGHIYRETDCDLFASVVHNIVGQQISTKALQTIWSKMNEALGTINAETILSCDRDQLQKFGMTYRKVDYILDFAQKVACGEFDIEAVSAMGDEDAVLALSSLKGIGVWTAEMILLFCLQRTDVFSYGDLAIHRGIRMVYGHKEIPKERFERYRKRFSPYCSVASLYFWAVAGGAIPELEARQNK